MKKTKIVATIGTASSSKEVLREMIESGLNVCRLNFSNASGFSILAITFAWCLRAEICFFNSIISWAERTNESAIQSAPLSSAKCKSFSSFSL